MRFIGYLRVSTDRQERSGLGLEAQLALIERQIKVEGGDLFDKVVEVESGSVDSRPGLQRALALCRKHKAILIIARLDRLGRRLSLLAQLLDADVDVRVADQPGASKLTLQLLAVVAEAERDMIRARTRDALAAAKARGVILGKHGREMGRQATVAAQDLLVAHPDAITDAFATATCLREAAAVLNARGVTTREAGQWHPSNTGRLMKRLKLRLGEKE
jgi:DNA invertase Pin-like site-specific DNA recombinase